MKFTLPKEKDTANSMAEVASSSSSEDLYEYSRRVSIPVNDEILKASPVGTEVTVTLKGKICMAEDDTHFDGEQIRVKVTEVDVKPANEFTELATDD